MRIAHMFLLAGMLAAVAASGCGDEGTGTAVGNSAARGPGAEAELSRCRLDPQVGGGYNVWIKDISCERTRSIIRDLGGRGHISKRFKRGVVRTFRGWACWVRKEGADGPVHNICTRGTKLVFFYVG